MMYIAEKTNKFWPEDPKAKYEVVQWVFWQMGNQGPKMGEHGHFARAAAINPRDCRIPPRLSRKIFEKIIQFRYIE